MNAYESAHAFYASREGPRNPNILRKVPTKVFCAFMTMRKKILVVIVVKSEMKIGGNQACFRDN